MESDVAVGSIARAARVLGMLARNPDGASLAEVVTATDFTKTTTHRVLSALQDVGMVAHDPARRIYTLGATLADIAYRAKIIDIASVARRPMRKLAEVTGDTVFLTIPEGAASVCVARELGSYPVRTLTLDRGERTPLGVGGGALALYSLMTDARRAASNRINARWLADFGVEPDTLEHGRAYFFEHGYAFNHGMVYPETSAVGMPIVTAQRRLVGSISIGALASRMSIGRIDTVVMPALRHATDALRELLADASGERLDPSIIALLEDG